MHRVIRIENPFGRGMYQSDRRMGSAKTSEGFNDPVAAIDLIGWQLMDAPRLSNEGQVEGKIDVRPGPKQDGIDLPWRTEDRNNWLFGFKDVKQLKAWFEEQVSPIDIMSLGLVIKVLYVTKVKHGGRQVCYHKNSVKREITLVHHDLNKLYRDYAAKSYAEKIERDAMELAKIQAQSERYPTTRSESIDFAIVTTSVRKPELIYYRIGKQRQLDPALTTSTYPVDFTVIKPESRLMPIRIDAWNQL